MLKLSTREVFALIIKKADRVVATFRVQLPDRDTRSPHGTVDIGSTWGALDLVEQVEGIVFVEGGTGWLALLQDDDGRVWMRRKLTGSEEAAPPVESLDLRLTDHARTFIEDINDLIFAGALDADRNDPDQQK